MDANDLTVLLTLPHQARPVVGEQRLQRLAHAHPRVRVEFVADQEELATHLPRADGLLLLPGFCLPPAALAPDARLRWIHWLAAGVDHLLTPELIGAEHVHLTSCRGTVRCGHCPPLSSPRISGGAATGWSTTRSTSGWRTSAASPRASHCWARSTGARGTDQAATVVVMPKVVASLTDAGATSS